MLITIVAILVSTFLAYLAWSRYLEQRERHEYEVVRGIPYGPVPNLFWATVKRQKLEDFIRDNIRKYGKVFGLTMMYNRTVVIAEPELLKCVLSKDFVNFVNRRQFFESDKLFAPMLFNTRNEQWKRLRSIMTPTFTTGKLRRMTPLILNTTSTLLNNVELKRKENDGILELKQLTSAYMMDTIVQTAFGLKIDSLHEPNNPICVNAAKMFSFDWGLGTILLSTVFVALPGLAKRFELQFDAQVNSFFTKLVTKILEDKRNAVNKSDDVESTSSGKASNFIELLLETRSEGEQGELNGQVDNNKYITDAEIISQCVLFFIGGFETTASALCTSLHLLALNPDKQEKLYEQSKQTLDKLINEQASAESSENMVKPSSDLPLHGVVNFNNLSQFEYLVAVFNETLRLQSPAIFIEPRATKSMVLESDDGKHKVNIQAGDSIHIPIYCLHHDEEQFPKPFTFMPERFLEEPLNQFHKYAFIPFSTGPRNCVAKSLATFEIQFALLALVINYKFSVCERTRIPIELFSQPGSFAVKNCYLKVERRN